MQDEGEPLGRGELLEHDEQREPDRIRHHGLALWVRRPPPPAPIVVKFNDGLGQPGPEVVLAARAARPEHVEGDARHHGCEPATEVGDRGAVRAG